MPDNKIISRTPFDYREYRIVPVIASFDDLGHLRPLYVRIGEESLKIESSWTGTDFVNHTIYHCTVLEGGVRKPLVLSFVHDSLVWTIRPGSDVR